MHLFYLSELLMNSSQDAEGRKPIFFLTRSRLIGVKSSTIWILSRIESFYQCAITTIIPRDNIHISENYFLVNNLSDSVSQHPASLSHPSHTDTVLSFPESIISAWMTETFWDLLCQIFFACKKGPHKPWIRGFFASCKPRANHFTSP